MTTNKTYALKSEADVKDSVYEIIAEMIGPGLRVVDFGCGSGTLARTLAEQGCHVTGIDINPEGLEEAAKYCVTTRVADLDRTSPLEIVGPKQFDVVVFADVLEHLRDPARTLAASREVLVDTGFVVVSIPNIAHAGIILGLIDGRFEYQPYGILDDTHIRFFTRSSVASLLQDAGFTITGVARTVEPLSSESTLAPPVLPDRYSPSLIAEVAGSADAETLQFVVRAHLNPDSAPAVDMSVEKTKGPATIELVKAGELAALRSALRDAETWTVQLKELAADRDAQIVELTDHIAQVTALADERAGQIDQSAAFVAKLHADIAQLTDYVAKLHAELHDVSVARAAADELATNLKTELDRMRDRSAASEGYAEKLRDDLKKLRDTMELARLRALAG